MPGDQAAGQPRKRPIPCALILDDAQWADIDTLHFLEILYREALRERWPLLVLCTHWQQEWNLHKRQACTPNPNPEPRSIADLRERVTPPTLPPASEFVQRVWHEVAAEELAARHQDPDEAARFRTVLRETLTDWRTGGRLADLHPRDQILALNLPSRRLLQSRPCPLGPGRSRYCHRRLQSGHRAQ